MSETKTVLELTASEVAHLLTMLRDNEESGMHQGNLRKWQKVAWRITDKLRHYIGLAR